MIDTEDKNKNRKVKDLATEAAIKSFNTS